MGIHPQHLDYIMLMAYDLHGSWEDKTGFNAPLYGEQREASDDADDQLEDTLSVDWAVKEWLRRGCPRSKLIVGMATYGRSFTLRWVSTDKRQSAMIPGRNLSQFLGSGPEGYKVL